VSGGNTRFDRRILYGLYEVLLLAWLVWVWGSYEGLELKNRFHDVNPIQHVQEAHLGIASFLYAVALAIACRERSGDVVRILFLILCCLLWGTNRELDGIWERYELDIVYDSLKFITALPAIAVVALYPRSCWEGFLKIRSTSAFKVFCVGVGGYIAAQIVSEILEAFEVSRNYERATEESLELLMSAFFIYSGVEALIERNYSTNSTSASISSTSA
jgi:hypothetical protein